MIFILGWISQNNFLNLFVLCFFLQDMTQLLYYKNLCKEDLWLDCADKLTAMIQNIIEFAKLIPGFMRLSQDDQVSFLFLIQ